eukprot:TRINITY_DN5380_c0_g1_i1.p2 TRINITY_DN5380_c0_g1~~TRINITY_DN5380_c0_g1_i1.p2  ORF type:complete len:131 (-),score=14.03 TRINITY_DN5380_c0_g1_i1:215-607(-)
MAGKSASGANAGAVVPRAGGNRAAAPAGAAGAMRRRAGTQARKQTQSVMNFYTDDSPGMKIPPVMVLVASAIFILLVTMLHVIGKINGREEPAQLISCSRQVDVSKQMRGGIISTDQEKAGSQSAHIRSS